MTQEKYKQQLTADQQRVLDDAALAILKIKTDTVAALTAVGGAGFSDNWFPSRAGIAHALTSWGISRRTPTVKG